MYRTLWVALALITVSFAGCQDTEPSRVIVSLQIDSDSEQTWIYLYTIPRVKMGNFTISLNNDDQTLASVFSHQRNFSNGNIETDTEGFLNLKVTADLSEVFVYSYAFALVYCDRGERSRCLDSIKSLHHMTDL